MLSIRSAGIDTHPAVAPCPLLCRKIAPPGASSAAPELVGSANTSVSILRTEAGRNPYDKGLTDLIGELSTRSDEFRTRWAAHNVRLHRTGSKHFRHPDVGDLHLTFDALELPGEPALTLTAYSAEPGTPDADNLATLLASWVATHLRTPLAPDKLRHLSGD